MKRMCDPAHRSGHDFSAVVYAGALPFLTICRRCGRTVALGPQQQYSLKYERDLMPEPSSLEQPVAH